MKKSYTDALAPGDKLQNGKYLVIEVLGQTHFGITYLSLQTHLSEKVVIKEFFLRCLSTRDESKLVSCRKLNPEIFIAFRDLYLEEARALARCSSNEFVVQVKDTFEENGTFYSVTNYIFEDDLRKFVREHDLTFLPENEAIRIVRQIGDGLDFMHSQGIYHLDLSPEKVLVSKKGKAVIFDIGISHEKIPVEILKDHTTLLKGGYSPPEQYARNSNNGVSIDIYSLGAILYFLLTGSNPMPAPDRLHAKMPSPVMLNRQISDKTGRAVMKAMSTDPKERFQTVRDFMNELPQKTQQRKSFVFSIPILVAGAAVLLLLIVTGSYWWYRLNSNLPDEITSRLNRDTTIREDTRDLWSFGDESTLVMGVERTRGSRPVSYSEEGSVNHKDSLKIGKYYAVLIGVEEYDDRQLKLDNPVHDAVRLKNVLDSNYIFDNIVLLKNPDREEIFGEFHNLQLRMTENDNLLLFYAGHGQYDARTKKGYWLPRDAKQANIANWISNDQLKDFLATIKARHIMLITDACFGGSISRGIKAGIPDSTPLFSKMSLQLYKRRSVRSISSGFLEKVPDKSPFIQYLIDNLSINDRNVLSGMDLFYETKSALEKGCNKDVPFPVFDVIQTGVDNGGDFFFIRRNILRNLSGNANRK